MTERRRAERRRAEIDWKFYKKVFWLALPIALQSLITIGVNMLDTIMVGNLGEMSLSAVSLANQFIGVYQIFCMGLGMGASVLVSRYWGMQEAEPVKSIQALRKTICIVVRITVSLALLFAVVTLLIPQVVMRMYTQDAEIIRLGEIYFRFSVITDHTKVCRAGEAAASCFNRSVFCEPSGKLCIYFRKTWNATYGNRRSCAGNIDCETV